MATKVQDTQFQKRNILRFLSCLVLPAIVGFVLPWDKMVVRVVAAGAGAGLGWWVAQVWERASLKFYRCPRCKEQIGSDVTEWKEGRSVVLYCESCDVEWDTGTTATRPQDPDDVTRDND